MQLGTVRVRQVPRHSQTRRGITSHLLRGDFKEGEKKGRSGKLNILSERDLPTVINARYLDGLARGKKVRALRMERV